MDGRTRPPLAGPAQPPCSGVESSAVPRWALGQEQTLCLGVGMGLGHTKHHCRAAGCVLGIPQDGGG